MEVEVLVGYHWSFLLFRRKPYLQRGVHREHRHWKMRKCREAANANANAGPETGCRTRVFSPRRLELMIGMTCGLGKGPRKRWYSFGSQQSSPYSHRRFPRLQATKPNHEADADKRAAASDAPINSR